MPPGLLFVGVCADANAGSSLCDEKRENKLRLAYTLLRNVSSKKDFDDSHFGDKEPADG